MAVEHLLTESDTLQSLALHYLDDPNRWLEIAEYNELSQPYLVNTKEEKLNSFGRGYLTVSRASSSKDLRIPAGWTFKSKPSVMGGVVKVFVVTDEAFIPAGQQVGYIHVTCTIPGTFGNVSPNTVVEAGDEFKKNKIVFASVTNEAPFTGGRDSRVLTAGDSIYIPTTDSRYLQPKNLEQIADLIGGEDLGLHPSSGYARAVEADAYGDLRTIRGLENIKQAVNDRLMTEKGELPLHPEYGTNLPYLIGSARTPYTEKMVELEIYEALSYEDRITDVRITSLSIVGTTIEVVVVFKPSTTHKDLTMNLSLNYSGQGGTQNV